MSCGNCGGIVHGAVGLAKAVAREVVPNQTGIRLKLRAPKSVVDVRTKICEGCVHRNRYPSERSKVGLTFCGKCKCLLAAKLGDPAEKCPVNLW